MAYLLLPFQMAMATTLGLPVIALLARLGRNLPKARASSALAAPFGCVLAVVALLAFLIPTKSPVKRGVLWRAGQTGGIVRTFERLFESHRPAQTLYFFTTSVAGSFPAVNYLGLTWASRFPHLWPLPAVIRWRNEEDGPVLEERASRMATIEDYLMDAVVADLERYEPDLVLVDLPVMQYWVIGVPFDFIRYFSRDPRFASLWSRYEEVGRHGRAIVYRRRGLRPGAGRSGIGSSSPDYS
jgi:hypothetical protein